jgi:glucosamine--fructose-6-phosphate aminotransferase (isomerizing)
MAGIGKDSVMYETIHRQPDDLRRVLGRNEDIDAGTSLLMSARRIFLVGIGTSYHAALMGAWCLRSLGLDARAVSSFDFANYNDTFSLADDDAVVLLSHSGARRYSSAALRITKDAGATLMSVGGDDADHPGSSLILRTTPTERSAAFTSSHTTAMTVLGQLAAACGERNGHPDAPVWRNALAALPEQIEEMLEHENDINALAEAGIDAHLYVVGGGPSECSALEAVIKAREAAYVRMDGMALEQFIHGPMICLQPQDQVVLIHADGASTDRSADALKLFRTLGTRTSLIGQAIGSDAPAFTVPATVEALSPILTTVPMQLLAWRMATLKAIDPDLFRTNEPAFKAAVSGIAL